MKNFLFVIALVLSISPILKADYGPCVLYQAKFYLKDGTNFNGCFEVYGHEGEAYLDSEGKNEFCNDKGMIKLFKNLQSNQYYTALNDGGIQNEADFGKVAIFKQIHYLNLKKRFENPHYELPYYGFIPKEEIVFLDSSEIEKIVFWDAQYSKRAWVGADFITCEKSSVETIKEEKYWNSITVGLDFIEEDSLIFGETDLGSMSGFQLFNYNEKINEAELIRLSKLKFSKLNHTQFWDDFYEENPLGQNSKTNQNINRLGQELYEKEVQKLVDWFWERKVLMVSVWQGC